MEVFVSRFVLPAVSVFAGALFAACFNPESGDYVIEPDGDYNTDCPESDTGGDVEYTESTAEVEINDDKDEMEITMEDATESIECELDGMEFTCDGGEAVYDFASYGYDAVMTVTAGMDGAWSSNTTFEGNSWSELDCSGADCATLQITSCGGDIDFTAELDE
jgi:hypothetical protein